MINGTTVGINTAFVTKIRDLAQLDTPCTLSRSHRACTIMRFVHSVCISIYTMMHDRLCVLTRTSFNLYSFIRVRLVQSLLRQTKLLHLTFVLSLGIYLVLDEDNFNYRHVQFLNFIVIAFCFGIALSFTAKVIIFPLPIRSGGAHFVATLQSLFSDILFTRP